MHKSGKIYGFQHLPLVGQMIDSWTEAAKLDHCVLEFELAFETYKGLTNLGNLLHWEPPHTNGEVICHGTTP